MSRSRERERYFQQQGRLSRREAKIKVLAMMYGAPVHGIRAMTVEQMLEAKVEASRRGCPSVVAAIDNEFRRRIGA